MKMLRTVTVTRPVACDASIAAAHAAVDSLTPVEQLELLDMLRNKYPHRFVSG